MIKTDPQILAIIATHRGEALGMFQSDAPASRMVALRMKNLSSMQSEAAMALPSQLQELLANAEEEAMVIFQTVSSHRNEALMMFKDDAPATRMVSLRMKNLDVMKSSVSLVPMLPSALQDLLAKAEEEAMGQYQKDISNEHTTSDSKRIILRRDQTGAVGDTTQDNNVTRQRGLETKTSDDMQGNCSSNNPIAKSNCHLAKSNGVFADDSKAATLVKELKVASGLLATKEVIIDKFLEKRLKRDSPRGRSNAEEDATARNKTPNSRGSSNGSTENSNCNEVSSTNPTKTKRCCPSKPAASVSKASPTEMVDTATEMIEIANSGNQNAVPKRRGRDRPAKASFTKVASDKETVAKGSYIRTNQHSPSTPIVAPLSVISTYAKKAVAKIRAREGPFTADDEKELDTIASSIISEMAASPKDSNVSPVEPNPQHIKTIISELKGPEYNNSNAKKYQSGIKHEGTGYRAYIGIYHLASDAALAYDFTLRLLHGPGCEHLLNFRSKQEHSKLQELELKSKQKKAKQPKQKEESLGLIQSPGENEARACSLTSDALTTLETCAGEIVAEIFNSKYGTAEHSKTDSSDDFESTIASLTGPTYHVSKGRYESRLRCKSINGTYLGTYHLASDAALARDLALKKMLKGPGCELQLNFSSDRDHRALREKEMQMMGVEVDLEKTLSSMSVRVNAAVEKIQSPGAGVVPRSSAQRMDKRNTKNSKRDSTRGRSNAKEDATEGSKFPLSSGNCNESEQSSNCYGVSSNQTMKKISQPPKTAASAAKAPSTEMITTSGNQDDVPNTRRRGRPANAPSTEIASDKTTPTKGSDVGKPLASKTNSSDYHTSITSLIGPTYLVTDGRYESRLRCKGIKGAYLGIYHLASDAALARDLALKMLQGSGCDELQFNFSGDREHRNLREKEVEATGLEVDLEETLSKMSTKIKAVIAKIQNPTGVVAAQPSTLIVAPLSVISTYAKKAVAKIKEREGSFTKDDKAALEVSANRIISEMTASHKDSNVSPVEPNPQHINTIISELKGPAYNSVAKKYQSGMQRKANYRAYIGIYHLASDAALAYDFTLRLLHGPGCEHLLNFRSKQEHSKLQELELESNQKRGIVAKSSASSPPVLSHVLIGSSRVAVIGETKSKINPTFPVPGDPLLHHKLSPSMVPFNLISSTSFQESTPLERELAWLVAESSMISPSDESENGCPMRYPLMLDFAWTHGSLLLREAMMNQFSTQVASMLNNMKVSIAASETETETNVVDAQHLVVQSPNNIASFDELKGEARDAIRYLGYQRSEAIKHQLDLALVQRLSSMPKKQTKRRKCAVVAKASEEQILVPSNQESTHSQVVSESAFGLSDITNSPKKRKLVEKQFASYNSLTKNLRFSPVSLKTPGSAQNTSKESNPLSSIRWI